MDISLLSFDSEVEIRPRKHLDSRFENYGNARLSAEQSEEQHLAVHAPPHDRHLETFGVLW